MSGDTRTRGSRVREPRATPPRRVLLIGGAAAALAILTDRGLRLDLPQPPPPVPTRRAAPDEALLVAVVRDLDDLLRAWPRASKPAALAKARDVLTEQRRVLEGRLTNDGVPTEEITARPTGAPAAPAPTTQAPTGSATSAPTPTPSPTTRLSVADLASRLVAVPTEHLLATTDAAAGTRELLTAAYGSLYTCAGLLGANVPPSTATTAVRGDLAERTSPLVYAFEVVAAQSSGSQRRRALAALDRLRALERLVGRAAGTSGWSLPFPVTDQSSARRLADSVLSRALGAVGELLGAAPTAESLDNVARWLAAIQLAAVAWGRDPVAFPGMEQ